MTQKKIDISVITPFYNGNAYMEQLFGCIRRNAQAAPFLAIELVLVNDSPDCAIEYDPDWTEGFSLKLCRNPVNAGIHQSRINGLQASGGTFVVFLDQDDLLTDDALLSQYHLAEHADVVVANGYNENRSTDKPIYASAAHHRQVMFPRFYLSVGCMIVSPGQCLLRRTAIPQLWTEKPIRCNGADDYYLWLLLLQEQRRWQINPDMLYTHINTGDNLSTDLDRMLRSSAEVLDILQSEGILTAHQTAVAKRRFDMRRYYEYKGTLRKAAACIRYPDLCLELLHHTYLKKFCR